MAQLKNELAEKELIKNFRHEHSWLSGIKAKNNWVSNDVIKIPVQGAAPQVLIDNTIYPIQSFNREDGHIVVSLHKYDTENTEVSDDELETLPYEKLSDVQVQHRETLEDKTAIHGLYKVSAAAHSADTPIIECTGEVDPISGRRRMITADLIREWELQGKLLIPLQGRNKVLCVEHAADLMLEDSNRQKTWGQEWLQGKVPVSHAGFNLWVAAYTPTYEKVNGIWTKKAFEAVGGSVASISFHSSTVVKATGTVKRYARKAEDTPEFRKNTIGFRMYAIVAAMKDKGLLASVSPTP